MALLEASASDEDEAVSPAAALECNAAAVSPSIGSIIDCCCAGVPVSSSSGPAAAELDWPRRDASKADCASACPRLLVSRAA